jgi:hypothetical protein
MLDYLENAEVSKCMTCGHSCYKSRTDMGKTFIAFVAYKNLDTSQSRLDCRGYSCHQSHDTVDGVIMHPSDGEAWKHFNSVHPHFSAE